jgi:hypothetical protein
MADQSRQPDGTEIDQRHAEAAAEDAAMRAIDGDDGHGTIAFDEDCIGVGHQGAPGVFFAR